MLKSYTEWLLKWKYGVVALSLIAVAVLGFGASRLAFNNDTRFSSAQTIRICWHLKIYKTPTPKMTT